MQGFNRRHSTFQICNFIINVNGPDLFGKYKQCIREILSRLKIKNPDEETIREMYTFYDIYLQIKDLFKFPKENVETYIEQLEANFWTEKLKHKLAIEVFVMGRPSIGIIETILNMPNSKELLTFSETISSPIAAKRYLYNTKQISFKPCKSRKEIEVLWNEGKQTFISQIGTLEIEDAESEKPEKDSGGIESRV